MNSIPVHEMFSTWQGEGVHMGRKAFFIRTMGCPVKCPFCDSAGTWHPDWTPKEAYKKTVGDLLAAVLLAEPMFVVITGGEPAIWDLQELTATIGTYDIPIHLETSGGYPLKGHFDWITVSPKRWGQLLPEVAAKANEFKIIVQAPEDIAFYHEMIQAATPIDADMPIWLHPEWSQRNNVEVLNAISEAVSQHPRNFRAGYQLHKLYRVDARDSRSRPQVPLGGEPKNGF